MVYITTELVGTIAHHEWLCLDAVMLQPQTAPLGAALQMVYAAVLQHIHSRLSWFNQAVTTGHTPGGCSQQHVFANAGSGCVVELPSDVLRALGLWASLASLLDLEHSQNESWCRLPTQGLKDRVQRPSGCAHQTANQPEEHSACFESAGLATDFFGSAWFLTTEARHKQCCLKHAAIW